VGVHQPKPTASNEDEGDDMEASGMSGGLVRQLRKSRAMSWMEAARDPPNSCHGGGWETSREYMMSVPRRCGVLCIAHMDNRQRMVLLSERVSKRWETCDLVQVMKSARNDVTKLTERSTGWPRTHNPSVT
jgi:hypothetical protein